MNEITANITDLIKDISVLIDNAKVRVAIKVNSEMTMLYWNIGKRIQEEILKSTRAEYGQEVIKMLAKDLLSLYGRGFSRTALIRMNQFYQSFQNQQISATVSRQLSWSHIVELLPLKEQNQRVFYAYMSIQENWSVRKLRSNIDKMLYERTKLSQKPNNEQVLSLLK